MASVKRKDHLLSDATLADLSSRKEESREWRKKTIGMNVTKYVLIALGIGSVVLLRQIPAAQAASTTNVLLGGTVWRIPSQVIDSQSSPKKGFNSVSLSFELPDFTPVNEAHFSGVNPKEDRPIVTAIISDDPKAQVGAPLLKTYISEAQIACPKCVTDPSSLGGIEYASWDAIGAPPSLSEKDGLFRLYEFPSSDGQFAICRFAANLATLPCETVIRLNTKLTVKIDFPIEYLSQGIALVKAVSERLAGYSAGPRAIDRLPTAFPPPVICWEPVPGSQGAVTVPLKFGPETWHIPLAFGATFGQNQTQASRYNSFDIWLKLPDLEPLTATDPSPIVIAGQGKYIYISFEYNNSKWNSETRNDSLKRYLLGLHQVSRNAFFSYEEYQGGVSDSLHDPYSEEGPTFLVSDDTNQNSSTFPPEQVMCYLYSAVPSPGCVFDVIAPINQISPNQYAGTYLVHYDYSLDYFSQLISINSCVQKLYQLFRFGDGI